MPFACLFVPHFPVQAVVRFESKLRAQAVAILEGRPPMAKVVAANQQAQRAGIAIGMSKLQAEACGVHLCQRCLQQEQFAHAALLDCAMTFSPRVEDTAQGRHGAACTLAFDDVVTLDIRGCEKLFGPPEHMARELACRIRQLGLDAHIAIAGNPDAALLAARGFAGITVIPAGCEAERLGELPVAALAPGKQILETLARWGITTLRAFAALPEVAVVERLGQEGRHWQMLARGAESRLLVPKEPGLIFEECIELEHAVDLLEPLLFLLKRVLDQVCARLTLRALATSEVRIQFELERNSEQHGLNYSRVLKLPVPVQKSETLLKLLQLDLRAHPPPAPVLAIHVKVEPVQPRATQGGLFAPKSPEPERLEITLARVRKIVGEERSGSPLLLDTHCSGAFRMVRFAPPEISISPAGNSAASATPQTALRVFRPPLAVRVEVHEGSPVLVFLQGLRAQVLALAGPWRMTGGWWSDTRWARDEWDVLLKSSVRHMPSIETAEETALYRIFKEIRSGQWFLEGRYD